MHIATIKRLMAAMSFAAFAFAANADEIDITAAVRAEGAASVSLVSGTAYAAGTPGTAGAFDGDTTTSNGRALFKSKVITLQYAIGASFMPGMQITVTRFKMVRTLASAFEYVARMPTGFSFQASSSGAENSFTELFSASDLAWKSSAEMEFDIPAEKQGDYRYYRLVTTGSASTDGVPLGFQEVILYGTVTMASSDGSLTVESNRGQVGTVTPGYGMKETFDGDTVSCSATEPYYANDTRYEVYGYDLSTFDGAAWGEPQSFEGNTVELPTPTIPTRLTWKWAETGYKVNVSTETGDASELVALSPAPDADGYFPVGTEVTATAVASISTPTQATFDRWVDLDTQATDAAAAKTFSLDAPRNLFAQYNRHWVYQAASADTKNLRSVTDGNWVLLFRAQNFDFSNRPDFATPAALGLDETLSGSGRLDLRTLNADIAGSAPFPVRLLTSTFMKENGNVTEVIIPADIPGVTGPSFSACPNLTNAVCYGTLESYNFLHAESTSLGPFHSCPALRNLSVPEATMIPHNLATQCTALKSIALPATVTNIQRAAFSKSGLEEVAGEGTPDIGSYAFANCTSLRSVPSFAGIKSIGERAFDECANLEAMADFSELTYLGDRAFRNCAKLTGTADLRNVKEFQNPANNGAFIQAGITGVNLTGNPVRMVPGYLCYQAPSLASVSLDNTVTNIGNCAFKGATALTSVTPADFASSIETLGFAVFRDTKLEGVSVVFGKALKTMEGFYPPKVPTAANNDESGYTFANTFVRVIDLSNTTITGIPDHFCSSCVSLEELRLPKTFTTFGTSCFGTSYTNMTLTKILFAGPPPTTVPDNWSAYWDGKANDLKGRDYKMVVGMSHVDLDDWLAEADFVPLAEIEDVESKPNYATVSAEYRSRLLGTWKGKWAVDYTPPYIPTLLIIK